MATEVPFVDHPRSATLTSEQQLDLEVMHPTGVARFWGATSMQNRKLDELGTGDVVVFTGNKLIRGVGEIGVILRNPDFADTLWKPDVKNGTFVNVYSLRRFQPLSSPYRRLWELDGFNDGDNFMGLRIIRDERVQAILSAFHVTTKTAIEETSARAEAVAAALEAHSRVAAPEGVHTRSFTYHEPGIEVFVDRTEAILVEEYRQWLTGFSGMDVARLNTVVGPTDLFVSTGDESEILEAKSDADHRMVRLAAGQLLDYAYFSGRAIDRLAALLPDAPDAADIGYLHSLGIDCVYRTGHLAFERAGASAARREHMRLAWTSVRGPEQH